MQVHSIHHHIYHHFIRSNNT